MLTGKCVILGITGSIAAYKSAYLASSLKKLGCAVHVIMTRNACEFISPKTFETLTGNKCVTDMFEKDFKYDVEHVSLAKKADLIMIAPATANIIAKMANGIADDMLTTTVLASPAIKIAAPAMNTGMYENTITQDNMDKLEKYGFEIVTPSSGLLACNDVGIGKMPEPNILLEHILRHIAYEKDIAGKRVLVTAGPTQEAIDPVRYITNHSTGKMGYAIAKACMLRGAEVTLVTGKTSLPKPMFVHSVEVGSAREMFEAVQCSFADKDYIFKAAAVADYTPQRVNENKIKKSGLDEDISIPLSKTIDILKFLGENKTPQQKVCGFSMETENMLENSKAKLEKKSVDMIAANSLRQKGAGFGTDTNVLTLITRVGTEELPMDSKENLAHKIIDAVLKL